MTPSRCVYCGDLAEQPTRLAWEIPDDEDESVLQVSIPLCVNCSHAWCPQPRARTRSLAGSRES